MNDGKWRLEYQGEALIFSSGLVYTNTTKPKGLTLREVLELINKHPRYPYYQKTLTRRLTLADSLARHRIEDIGKPLDFSVSLSFITQKHDRDFKTLPWSGEQLLKRKYKSKPRRV